MISSTDRRIIPSIYTSDGQFALTDTSNILSYTEAMEQLLRFEADGADEIHQMRIAQRTIAAYKDFGSTTKATGDLPL
jgi:hypothetical protein